MKNIQNTEYRQVDLQAEVKREEGSAKKLILRGYPILFNSPTKVYDWCYGEITETILPTALDGVNLDDVFLIVCHNLENVLGKNNVNMTVKIEDVGVYLECELPNTQLARDTYNLIEAKIIDGMSFGFKTSDRVNPETLTRTITHFDAVYEFSITPLPAYKDAVIIAKESQRTAQEREAQERAKKLYAEIDDVIKGWN